MTYAQALREAASRGYRRCTNDYEHRDGSCCALGAVYRVVLDRRYSGVDGENMRLIHSRSPTVGGDSIVGMNYNHSFSEIADRLEAAGDETQVPGTEE